MSKSSIKTKTVLTMTDMTKSTELQAFKRPRDGYKVTVKISLLKQMLMSFSVFFNASLAPTEDSYKYESRAAFTLYR